MNEPITTMEARLLAADISHVRTDQARMAASIEAISASLQVLTRLESTHGLILERLSQNNKQVDEHEVRVQNIERDMPGLRELRKWVIGGVLASVGMMGASLVKITLVDSAEMQKYMIEQSAKKPHG